MAENTSRDSTSSRSWRKWVAAGIFLVFFGGLVREVINPYRGQRFEKIPHGDHVHFVPKDRNSDVSVSQFPTREPDADERITPDGEVVSREDAEDAP